MNKRVVYSILVCVTLMLNGCASKANKAEVTDISKKETINTVGKEKSEFKNTNLKFLIVKSETNTKVKKSVVKEEVKTDAATEKQVIIKSRDKVSILLEKITAKKISSYEERMLNTSFHSLNDAFTVVIGGIEVKSMNIDLPYKAINKNTACQRYKQVTLTDANTSHNLLVCETTNYEWIVY